MSTIEGQKVIEALGKVKEKKAVAPNDIRAEVYKCCDVTVELTELFNTIAVKTTISKAWWQSYLVPIFKQKGNVQD